jgi:hypothetical protein
VCSSKPNDLFLSPYFSFLFYCFCTPVAVSSHNVSDECSDVRLLQCNIPHHPPIRREPSGYTKYHISCCRSFCRRIAEYTDPNTWSSRTALVTAAADLWRRFITPLCRECGRHKMLIPPRLGRHAAGSDSSTTNRERAAPVTCEPVPRRRQVDLCAVAFRPGAPAGGWSTLWTA